VLSGVPAFADDYANDIEMFSPELLEEGSRLLDEDYRYEDLLDGDEVRIIIELMEEPIIEFATVRGIYVNDMENVLFDSMTDELIDEHTTVKNEIKSASINLDCQEDFTNVINGFSGITTFAEAKKIENLSKVKKVSIVQVYSRPEPEMLTSGDMVFAGKTWSNLKTKGEGMVISVIDTGIDPSHKDMNITDSSKIDLNNQKVVGLIKDKELKGQWRTEKVPYGYNYMDKNQEIRDIAPGASMHGMHVAGTVGANGNADGIKGVAPEAQLLAMKVFGNDPKIKTTYGDVVIAAIDDSIALGADAINMSLGSTAGFTDSTDPEQMAVARAVKNGIVVAISAGNSAYFGNGFKTPYASNPDLGVTGSPSSAIESLSVASNENTHIYLSYLNYNNGTEDKKMAYIPSGAADPVAVFTTATAYEYCGLGDDAGFKGKDVKGKIALIQRGSYSFKEKCDKALENGASGVIVFNHANGGDVRIAMGSIDEMKIPALFIGNTDGAELLKGIDAKLNKVNFTGNKMLVSNPNSGKMSDFTSWGVTPNLTLKPEITAPGGQIYSTLNDNKYGTMSGTSMAAPHVAGGMALIMKYVDDTFKLTGEPRAIMAKNLAMNTAQPVIEKGAYNVAEKLGTYYSPRRQGAGSMDLYAATTTEVIVVDPSTGFGKVELKEIGNKVNFKLKVQNFSNEEKTYKLNGTIASTASTDKGEIEAFPITTGNRKDLLKVSFNGSSVANEEIKVPAKGTAEFEVSFDLNQGHDWYSQKQLKEAFVNGNFIEGHIQLTDKDDKSSKLTVPYLGFYGQWDKAPNLDTGVFEPTKTSFYNMTFMVDGKLNFLGRDLKGQYSRSQIAISPNGDGAQDDIMPVLSFLRNVKELDVNILSKDGKKIRDVAISEKIRKNYHDGDKPQYKFSKEWLWDGKANNKLVSDGEYTFEIRTKIDYPNAQWQTVQYPVVVDTLNPEIQSVDINSTRNIVQVNATDKGSSIRYYALVENGKPLSVSLNGKFTLENLAQGKKVSVAVADFAGNIAIHGTPIVVGGETNAPVVKLVKPDMFAVFNKATIDFTGTVTDESKVEKLTINNKSIPLTFDETKKEYTFADKADFTEGKHDLDITATDILGNTSNFKRPIFVDLTAPTVEMLEWTDKVVVPHTTDKVILSANINDNFPDLKVKVNGNIVKNISNAWEYFDRLKPAQYKLDKYEQTIEFGENTITVEAYDGAGNETIKTLKVYRLNENETGTLDAVTTNVENTTVEEGTKVTLTATEGSTLYYTVDGSEPTASSLNNGTNKVELTINEDTTVKAFATKGYFKSPVSTFAYTIKAEVVAPIEIGNLMLLDFFGYEAEEFNSNDFITTQFEMINTGQDILEGYVCVEVIDSNGDQYMLDDSQYVFLDSNAYEMFEYFFIAENPAEDTQMIKAYVVDMDGNVISNTVEKTFVVKDLFDVYGFEVE